LPSFQETYSLKYNSSSGSSPQQASSSSTAAPTPTDQVLTLKMDEDCFPPLSGGWSASPPAPSQLQQLHTLQSQAQMSHPNSSNNNGGNGNNNNNNSGGYNYHGHFNAINASANVTLKKS